MRIVPLAALALSFATPLWADSHDITVSHGISAFGSLKYPADFTHFDYVNPNAPKGGFMSYRGGLASTTFDSVNAFILDGEPAQGLELIHDSLLVRAWDEPDAAYGRLAESIEYPEDRSWVIFNMRPEARFTDGHPVTAEDVVFTIEMMKTEATPRISILIKDVEDAEALGDHRVKVNFVEGANTRDLISIVGQLDIIPAHYYAEVDFTKGTLEPPVASGPYVIDDIKPGRSIRYCHNPDYWGWDLAVNAGTYNIECVTFEYFADRTASFEALKAGEYYFHEEFFSAQWATGYDFPALNEGWVIRDTLDDGRAAGAQGFWFNIRRPNLSDPRVREAIALAFNFEWSNETLFYGLYNRTDSFWESTAMEAQGAPEGAELALLEPYRDQLPESVFSDAAYSPPVNGTENADRRTLRRAANLLEEAGWTVGDDGLRRNADGDVLTIEFVDDGPVFERIVLPYIDNLERIGVSAEFVLLDQAQMQQRQEDFDYDIIPARLNLPLTPSVELRAVFGSDSANAPGSLNLSGVDDPVIDGLIETALGATNREDLDIAVQAIDRVLRAKHIWAPQWFKGSHWIAYWDMYGRPEIKPPFRRGEEFWWFDQAGYDRLIELGALR